LHEKQEPSQIAYATTLNRKS